MNFDSLISKLSNQRFGMEMKEGSMHDVVEKEGKGMSRHTTPLSKGPCPCGQELLMLLRDDEKKKGKKNCCQFQKSKSNVPMSKCPYVRPNMSKAIVHMTLPISTSPKVQCSSPSFPKIDLDRLSSASLLVSPYPTLQKKSHPCGLGVATI